MNLTSMESGGSQLGGSDGSQTVVRTLQLTYDFPSHLPPQKQSQVSSDGGLTVRMDTEVVKGEL